LISPEILSYCVSHSTAPSDLVKELGAYTVENIPGANMLIGEMEAAVLGFLIKLGGVKRVLELGTFTGYSALAMAEQLPDDGTVTTVDINPHTTKVAREFWDRSPHGHKIMQILKPGLDALAGLSGPFDLVFIDADKNGYPSYLEWSLAHLSPRGLVVTDNTLWSGRVLERGGDKQTDSIIAHNDRARALPGYTKVLLPVRDGMYLITKN
jgi:caffeoyl-CoA O-methyltransferase